jgi:hypothetical protein
MNPNPAGDGFDPLEAELAALTPRPPAGRVRDEIARRLAGGAAGHLSRRRIWLRAALGLAAAVGLALLGWQMLSGNRSPAPRGDGPRLASPGPRQALPPVAVRAFDRSVASPEDVDRLLDRLAPPPTGTEAAPPRAFTGPRLALAL